MENNRKPVRSFYDLEVYRSTYEAMLRVYREILPKLPMLEEYDFKDQLRKSINAIPRFIAEGYLKRHNRKEFQRYINDAIKEAKATIVLLSQVMNLYSRFIDSEICEELIYLYNKANRQLYNLIHTRD